MMRATLRRSLSAAALALAATSSCGGDVAYVDITLVLKTCENEAALQPLRDGANRLKFTVYGRGIDPFELQRRENVSTGAVELAGIPPGVDRNIVVEAVTPQGEVTVARGESGPLDLSGATPASIAIFLRRADSFTRTVPMGAPTTCSDLATKRAGHTATLLSDGRVLIAGGYFDFEEDGVLKRQPLKSTEIYDPRTGTFRAGPDLRLPRMHHTATHVPGTRLTVIAGGESSSGASGAALKAAEVYDEERGSFALRTMREQRTRHAAAVPPSGGPVILIGGYDGSGRALQSTEQFDPKSFAFVDGPALPAPGRGELTAVGLPGGRVLAIGGWDGTKALPDVVLLEARSGAPRYEISKDFTAKLAEGRLLAGAALLDADRAVITGGYTTRLAAGAPLHAGATNVTDVVNLESRTVTRAASAALTAKRGLGGTVALADGQILVASGAFENASRKPETLKSANIIFPDDGAAEGVRVREVMGGAPASGRYAAAWTLLADGTVLVTGGLEFKADGSVEYLNTAEVFQPRYQTSKESPYR